LPNALWWKAESPAGEGSDGDNPAMATVYSTNEVHPRDRITYWVDVATKGFVRHEFRSNIGSAFQGSVRVSYLAALGVTTFVCDAAEVFRSARDVARADSDDLLLCLQLSGRSIRCQDGRQAMNDAGSFLLLDTRRPFTLSFEARSSSISFKIPRELLEARLGSVSAMTARSIRSQGPIAELTSGFLAMLPAQIDALDGQSAQTIADQSLDLVALAFSTECDQSSVALSSARATALLRLKSAVDAGLCDPELRPQMVAAAAGVSVRYANALLSHEETSLARYIQSQRLQRCRSALGDPAHAHRTIGEIAFCWGFSDLSHFGRRFKAEYGRLPSDYRREMRESQRLHDALL
jgi:AraC family transcriptional regulator, positive regulator of tynA and feaB